MTSWVALGGLAALLGTLVAIGCGAPQVQCQTDIDCGAAARCETESKTCVQRMEDTTCSLACADWEFCSESVCYGRYRSIAVPQPSPQAVVSGSATVRARLESVAPWIALRSHPRLAYAVSQGATPVNQGELLPAGDGGDYSGQIAVVAAGQYTLKAGFPGFPSGSPVSVDVPITVDVTAPAFRVDAGTRGGLLAGPPLNEQDPLLANAFKRNDVVTVSIGSDDADLDLGSIALSVQGVDAGVQTPFTVSAGSGCGMARCWSAVVDLATVEMWALRGRMTVTASGRDNAGNAGQGAIQIPVTRFKWSRAMPGVTSLQASPAVGASGTVYVGTTTGTLAAIKPDGTDKWAAPVSFPAAILASPAVGKGDGSEEVVYAIPNSNPPVLYAILGADGGTATVPLGPPTAGSPEASPLVAATTFLSDTRESATTFLNSPSASLGTMRFGSGAVATGSLGDAGSVTFPGNVVGSDNTAFAGDDVGRVREYQFASGAGAWLEQPMAFTTSDAPTGLALSSDFVAGASVGSIFTFPRSAGTAFSRTEIGPTIPVLIGGDLLYSVASGGGSAIRITPSGSGPGTPNAIASLGGTTTSALVATGQVSYFVRTSNSALHALSPNLTTLWSDTVEASVAVASSPNIDCARAPDGSKLPGPGTLYYGANNGKLYAIIVDNPGIDTTSPWPKYQHDPRNTGSLSTPLSEFTCP